jgi:hypothetical protein
MPAVYMIYMPAVYMTYICQQLVKHDRSYIHMYTSGVMLYCCFTAALLLLYCCFTTYEYSYVHEWS